MKRARQIASGLAACAWLLAGPVRAEDPVMSPVEMVNSLRNAQGEIAQGDMAAYAAQPRLLKGISEAFSASKPEVWQDARNARAAVIYLLSGGEPRVAARLLENGKFPQDEEKLMRGALAYVLGREAEARQLLGVLDPRSLDLTLGGQIAFVQSILLTTTDTRKAVALLDLARLLMPGGLIEEAALRRELVLVGDITRDATKFTMLAGQYVNRFPKSPYAANFLKDFTTTLLRLRMTDDVVNFPRIELVVENLNRDDRRSLYLTIARAALVNGKLAMAEIASSGALKLAAADSVDEQRGRLYQAAGRTLTDQYEPAVAQLRDISAKRLPRRDAALLAAARMVARRIREATAAVPTVPPPKDSADPKDDPVATTIHLAEAALTKSQETGSEATR